MNNDSVVDLAGPIISYLQYILNLNNYFYSHSYNFYSYHTYHFALLSLSYSGWFRLRLWHW